MSDKVTMKIHKDVHKKLLLAKVHMEVGTFDDLLNDLVSRYLEEMKSREK